MRQAFSVSDSLSALTVSVPLASMPLAASSFSSPVSVISSNRSFLFFDHVTVVNFEKKIITCFNLLFIIFGFCLFRFHQLYIFVFSFTHFLKLSVLNFQKRKNSRQKSVSNVADVNLARSVCILTFDAPGIIIVIGQL